MNKRDSVELDVQSTSESFLDETPLGVHILETSKPGSGNASMVKIKTEDDIKMDFEAQEKMEAAKKAWDHSVSSASASIQTSQWNALVTNDENSESAEVSVVDQIPIPAPEPEESSEPLVTTPRLKKPIAGEQQNVCKVKPQQQQQPVKPQPVPSEVPEEYPTATTGPVLESPAQASYTVQPHQAAIFTSKPAPQGFTYSFEQQALVPISYHEHVQTNIAGMPTHVPKSMAFSSSVHTTPRSKKTIVGELQNAGKVKPQQQKQPVKPQPVPSEVPEEYPTATTGPVLESPAQASYTVQPHQAAIFTSKPAPQGFTYSFEQQALVPISYHEHVQTNIAGMPTHVPKSMAFSSSVHTTPRSKKTIVGELQNAGKVKPQQQKQPVKPQPVPSEVPEEYPTATTRPVLESRQPIQPQQQQHQQQQMFRNQQYQQMLSNVQQFFAEDKEIEHQRKQKQANQKREPVATATTNSSGDKQKKRRQQIPDRRSVRTAQIPPQNRAKPSGPKQELIQQQMVGVTPPKNETEKVRPRLDIKTEQVEIKN